MINIMRMTLLCLCHCRWWQETANANVADCWLAGQLVPEAQGIAADSIQIVLIMC